MALIIGLIVVLIILPLLFSLFGFDAVLIPSDVISFISDGAFHTVFNSLSYVMPVSFGITCLIAVLLLRNFHLILWAVDWIVQKGTGH